jgi:NAD(P)-dependent dehydrogenase (short-subunit alcohol dehydrogenase family)
MVADGGGVIINVSTHGSLRPHPSYLPYAAAKAGLNTMTEGLAIAYGPTVRVNTLMPGPFLTDISKAWDLGASDLRTSDLRTSDLRTSDWGAPDWGDSNPFDRHPLQRAGDPSEIVGAALFLMSDASSYTTGAILHADGGFP